MAEKKRNKAYRPKVRLIPKIIQIETVTDVYPELPTKLYAAIITFCERPSIESCNHLSHQLCCVAGGMSHAYKGAPILHKRDAASNAIRSAILCIEAIGERYERTGVVGVTEMDRKTLHAAAGRLDEALQAIPLTCWRRAEREVQFWLREKTPMEREAA